ncbi:MAG: hypothetical protein K2Y39_09855 [Candidatus Obscuribacterales bacterium]|nr:hypothetical protein [Candidatus Obscuribacterales bacterium]
MSDYKNLNALAKQLLEVTSKGRVSDWIERIAVVARELGLSLAAINWNRSPECVAMDVSDKADRSGRMAHLETIVERMKQSQQDEATPS